MGHSFHKNFGHLVFRVANVEIQKDDLPRLHAYIGGIAKNNRIGSPIIGGIGDHVHFLGDFPVNVALSVLVSKLKASSSYWLKGLHSRYCNFSWQQGYGYFSVSASHRQRVGQYIINQEKHHAHMTTDEEYARLMEKYESCSNFETSD